MAQRPPRWPFLCPPHVRLSKRQLRSLGIRGVIYETLYITDYTQHKEYPWLATSYTWSKDLKTLTFTVRTGVRWSDGQPFTARDVYYTLWTLPHQCGVTCDQVGVLGKTSTVTAVTTPAANQVALHFRQANATQFFTLANNAYIMPQHIWSRVKKPTTWTNPDPVGTGPFTQIAHFTPQSVDFGRNPYYWQKGKPAFATLRQVDFTSVDAANLALEDGQIDWSGNLIPRVGQVYDARNPASFHHFYAAGFSDNALYLNDAKYPYSLVAFRKAISMAINRRALDVNADYGYQRPATPAGIDPWSDWMDKTIPNTLTQYNPAAARAMLRKAGFTWRNGRLIDPKGHRVAFDIIPTVGAAPGNWLGEAQILAQNFQAIGIDAGVRVLQFADYYDRLQKGNFDAVDGWGYNSGPSPYYYYQPMLDSAGYAPIGTATTTQNWERWKNPQMDKLFAEYRLTTDKGKQRDLTNQMQRLFVANMPAIPTVEEAIPENYSTQHYTGFPTAGNNYAYAAGLWNTDGELILLHLRPTR